MTILKEFINACGGKENLQRIQKQGSLVIAELASPDLRIESAFPVTFNAQLRQLCWQPDSPLAQQEWQILARIVDSNLRQKFKKNLTAPSLYKPTWHITAQQGFLGDPNGFVFFQGAYHLFYLISPALGEEKILSWAHLSSRDLINWTDHPLALTPCDWFDSHGVYSGHAISENQQLMIFYTGNVRIGEQRKRMTYQCLATSEDGIHFSKQGPVIDKLPPGVTAHCRDPKVLRNGDHWLMLLGAQLSSGIGRLACYRSKDLLNWEFSGICGEELGNFGYMWECPDLLQVNGQLIAIICPQGIPSNNPHYQVAHHNGYLKATLNAQDELKLTDFTRLDYGFDFYAMQTVQTPDNRHLLIAWMGLPDETDHPSKEEGWLHQLTCIRELHFANAKLYQRPARELQALRSDYQLFELPAAVEQQVTVAKERSVELQMTLSWLAGETVSLHFMNNDNSYCCLSLDSLRQKIVLDRSLALATDGEKVRELDMPNQDDIQLQILIDQSSIEIFINDGEFVMTAVVFTEPGQSRLKLVSRQLTHWHPISCWTLGQRE